MNSGYVENRTRFVYLALIPILIAAISLPLIIPAHAYGKSNWQVAFSGTATTPGSGGFGFWGWCAYSGVYSGSQGDCEITQYIHFQGSDVTCHESLQITSWYGGFTGDHFITGTAKVSPAWATDACLSIFPGSANFVDADTQVPLIPGHYNIKNGLGALGSLQIQVTFIG